jgi:hypothetical protein
MPATISAEIPAAPSNLLSSIAGAEETRTEPTLGKCAKHTGRYPGSARSKQNRNQYFQ